MEGKYVAYVGSYTHDSSKGITVWESIFMMWTSFGEL